MSQTTVTTVIPQRNRTLWLLLSFTIIGAFVYILLTWSDMHNAAQHINRTREPRFPHGPPLFGLL